MWKETLLGEKKYGQKVLIKDGIAPFSSFTGINSSGKR
jgi:hypothetical protein